MADVYDALTSKRIYKQSVSHDEAVRVLIKSSGAQFDPAIIEAFLRREKDFQLLSTEFEDPAAAQEQTADESLIAQTS